MPKDLASEKQSRDREELLCSAAVQPQQQVARRREEAICGGSCSLGGSEEGRVSCHRPPHVPCTDSGGPVLSTCDGDADAGQGRLMQGPIPVGLRSPGLQGPFLPHWLGVSAPHPAEGRSAS